MKLLFDATELSYFNEDSGHKAGVFYVSLNLFNELKKRGIDITFFCDFRRYYFMKNVKEFSDVKLLEENSLMNRMIGFILYKSDKFPLKIKYGLTILARIYDKYLYRENKKNLEQLKEFDVYFSPFSPPSKEIQNADLKRFRMIHDVIPILERGLSKSSKDWYNKIYNTINDKDFYVTNSECTRKDVLKYFPFIKEDHIKTTLLGANENFVPSNAGKDRDGKHSSSLLVQESCREKHAPSPLAGEGWGEGEQKQTHRYYAPYIKQYARKMRKEQTKQEYKLWQILRNKSTGYKFRRQFALNNKYIADFVCLKKRIIIEIDGGQHNGSFKDIERTFYLENENFKIIRFWNNEIDDNIEGCFEFIINELNTPHPDPLPQGERGDVSLVDPLLQEEWENAECCANLPQGERETVSSDKSSLQGQRDNVPKKLSKDEKYIFSLCTLGKRKNLIFGIRNFFEFINRFRIDDLKLVLGGAVWKKYENELSKELDKYDRSKIMLAGYIKEEDLSYYYSNALCFIYPSLYEGFGLPVLEAMQCGCPVITSNRSSLPEVIGDSGIQINPENDEEMIEAFRNMYFDFEFRNNCSLKGCERAKLFSWEKCASELLEFIKANCVDR